MDLMDLKASVRTIPDYPKPGIMFRDVTTLMGDPAAFSFSVEALAEAYRGKALDKVAGIEARGFIFGATLAQALGLGFIPVRKKGKLPGKTLSKSYALEYGEDTLEVHVDAVAEGENVLVIDDLLATGGTAMAAVSLLRSAGATVQEAGFVVDLPVLGGGKKLEADGLTVTALLEFDGH